MQLWVILHLWLMSPKAAFSYNTERESSISREVKMFLKSVKSTPKSTLALWGVKLALNYGEAQSIGLTYAIKVHSNCTKHLWRNTDMYKSIHGVGVHAKRCHYEKWWKYKRKDIWVFKFSKLGINLSSGVSLTLGLHFPFSLSFGSSAVFGLRELGDTIFTLH